MYNSDKKFFEITLSLLAHFHGYLKNTLPAGFSAPYKQALKESFDFLTTLENISGLGGAGMVQGVLPDRSYGPPKILLACAVSEEAEVVFFNISGSEIIELYAGARVAGVRKFFARAWHKKRLYPISDWKHVFRES